ncbi:hypothetical protein V1460_01170 [Streptomyces sp. SCSIO 30461]|uniref:hypothetical protein n=1 Tax=Streptomyces sp. SCSIO 30461 TaxID=3118085 RepID=UPI0030CE870B
MSAPPAVETSTAYAGAGLRLLRAAVFAAVCVVLSALGHVMASCAAVPWWTLAAGFLGVFTVVVPLAGRERSMPVIAAALTGGQLALHALFGLGQRQLTLAPTADDALIRTAAKLLCGSGAAALSPADAHRIVTRAGIDPASLHSAAGAAHRHPALAPPETTGLLPDLPMVLGHLLAALAIGWLLRRGEIALFRLARLSARGGTELAEEARARALRAALVFARALLAGLPGAPGRAPRALPLPLDTPLPPASGALQHTVIRRGPPAAPIRELVRELELAA